MAQEIADRPGNFEAMVAEVEAYMRKANDGATAAPVGVQAVAIAEGVPSFCRIWPTAKPIIEFLRQFIPAMARWVIDVLIVAGDRVCASK
jgi:hypothetical protein